MYSGTGSIKGSILFSFLTGFTPAADTPLLALGALY